MTSDGREGKEAGTWTGHSSLVTVPWRGWRDLPPSAQTGRDAWLELSHPLHADLGRIAFFPRPRFARIMSQPQHPLNVTEIQMVCHFGTHVDAPCHFIPDGPAFHEIPLDRLHGPGVVWRLDCEPYGGIEPAVFDRAQPALHPGDILLLDTGWADHFGTERYNQNPSLSVAAAQWLVEHGVKLVGVDFATPDLAVDRRVDGFDDTHQQFRGHHAQNLSHAFLIQMLTARRDHLIKQRETVAHAAFSGLSERGDGAFVGGNIFFPRHPAKPIEDFAIIQQAKGKVLAARLDRGGQLVRLRGGQNEE